MNRQRRTQIQVQKDELRFSISNDSSYMNSLWKQSTLKLLNIYMISFPFNFRSFLQLVHNQWWKMVSLDEFYHFSCNKDFQSFSAKLIQRKCAFWIRWFFGRIIETSIIFYGIYSSLCICLFFITIVFVFVFLRQKAAPADILHRHKQVVVGPG